MTELPPSWRTARLDAVAEVKLGRQRSPKNHTGDRMRPYLRAANVRWDGLDLSDVKEMNFTESESNIFELKPGDVLVAEASGSASEVGKPAIWRGDISGCCFQNTLLRVRSGDSLVPEYILRFLAFEARAGRLGGAARGVGIHHIGATRLAAWSVPIPPLDEQRRIVVAIEEQFSRLDAAELMIQRVLGRIRQLRGAAVAAALQGEWEWVTLDDVTEVQQYGSSAKASETFEGTAVPMLRMGNIQDGEITFEDLKYLAESHADVNKYELRPGDLLFNRTNSPDLVGKSAVYREGSPRAIFASYMIRVRLTARCTPDWAALVINSPIGRRYIAEVRTQQVGQANVNGTKLKSLPLPLPTVDEQRNLVADTRSFFSMASVMERELKKVLQRLAGLRSALLADAFAGRLF